MRFLSAKLQGLALRLLGGLVRMPRHYSREILIAFVFAVVATVIIDPFWSSRAKRLRQRALQNNLEAVATLEAVDKRNRPTAEGSGFFVTRMGVLVTNYHVIRGAADVIAHVPSGAFYRMRRIRDIDDRADIAILEFDARDTPVVLGPGDSDRVRAGDEVYALGTPHGLESTYTAGVVSNVSRRMNGEPLIQFSAQVSPGSSGGGLFNREGEVIGITAASLNLKGGPQSGLDQNLNFAIPINRVRNMLNPEPGSDLKSGSPGFYYSLGNLADNRRQLDRAIQLYNDALSIDPNYTAAYMGLADDYYEKGDYVREVEAYLKAVASDPQNAQALYYLGTAYEQVGEYDNAVNAYNRALAIDPTYKDALHDLSIVYLTRGEPQKARQLLPRLMASDKGWGGELQILARRVTR